MLKRIEKPDTSKIGHERLLWLFGHRDFSAWIHKSNDPYASWDQVKYWRLPAGIKPEEVWAAIKLLRKGSARPTPISQEDGDRFAWRPLPDIEAFLHDVDMKLGGSLMLFVGPMDDRQRHRFLSRGVMEEAIASSQLEGAHTTRKVAKQMLLENRKPRNTSERMILNNYRAIQLIEEELKGKKLDEATLFRLHEVLMKDTKPSQEIGRYRKDEDEIVVGGRGAEVYFIPPGEIFLRKEMKKFLAFANNDLQEPGFLHPVLKAILLHFWMGFLHPFTDGNGRMARNLFYWYLLRENYWAFAFMPLSTVIKRSPGQYRDAFVYSEQDDSDLTYFLEYNVRKIRQAMSEFEAYVRKKEKENSKMAVVARDRLGLNDRQIQVVRYFLQDDSATTSVTTHQNIYGIARMTAVKDLAHLKGLGFLSTRKIGRVVYYYATEKLRRSFE